MLCELDTTRHLNSNQDDITSDKTVIVYIPSMAQELLSNIDIRGSGERTSITTQS